MYNKYIFFIFLIIILYIIYRKLLISQIKKYKICCLMWYDSNISNFADINYKINKIYCDKYEYDLICSNPYCSYKYCIAPIK